tara:strand:+ start:8749 stop:9756 length:1008 start_codon:yes stop_codon:yes gene_type:complete
MIDNPTVTIGLTTFNRPDFLREAVQSVMNQTYVDFKLLIGNDDPSNKVTFKNLGIPDDSRIEILNYSKNIGEIANMNNLLNITNTEWFTWMADDDVFHSVFLESLVESLKTDSRPLSASYTLYKAGNVLEDSFFNDIEDKKPVYFEPADFILQYVSRKVELIGCYGLMNTKKLKIIGGMPKLGNAFAPYSDTLLPILLSEHGGINYIDMPLTFLRTHEDSPTAASTNFNAYITAESDFLARLEISCNNIGEVTLLDQSIYNMVSWFRDNEFSVISRNQSISRSAVILSFISYQIRVNYPRIKIKFWARFTIVTLVLLAKVIINSVRKFFLNLTLR